MFLYFFRRGNTISVFDLHIQNLFYLFKIMIEQYTNQQHTIFHGDAISILSNHIASESVDLIGKKVDLDFIQGSIFDANTTA